MSATNILVNIVGEFKKKGFDDAGKASNKLEKSFAALGKKLAAAFSVTAITKFTKTSIKAFIESEKATRKLTIQLERLNLGFASPIATDYLKKLSYATGVADEQLAPALQRLSTVTGDLTTAQKMLGLALDISLTEGKDLNQVSTALALAFKGQTTALTRLKIGFTTTELKGKKFNDVLKLLQDRYAGGAAKAVDNAAGALDRIKVAFGEAQESFGEGFVKGLEDSGSSVEDFQKQIDNLGESLGTLSAAIVSFTTGAAQNFDKLANSQGVKAVAKLMELLGTHVLEPMVFGQTGQSWSTSNAKRQYDAAVGMEEMGRSSLRRQRELLRAERRVTQEKNKQTEAAKKLADAEKKRQGIIDKAGQTFDMERIQIEAALKGKINDVEENRLKLQRAILNENTTEIIKYQGLLKDAEGQLATLQAYLASLPEMAKNPFTDWKTVIGDIETLLKQLDYQIPIDVLFKNAGLQIDWSNMTVSQIQTMSVNAGVVNILGAPTPNTAASVTNPPVITPDGTVQIPSEPAPEPPAPVAGLIGGTLVGDLNDLGVRIGESTGQVLAEIPVATPEQVLADFPLLNTPVSEILGTQPVIDPAYIAPVAGLIAGTLVGNFQDLATRTGEPLADIGSTAPSFLPPFLSFDWSSMDMTNLGAPTPPIVVNVNVEGNVTTETDLVAAVTEGLQLNSRIGIPTIIDRLAV